MTWAMAGCCVASATPPGPPSSKLRSCGTPEPTACVHRCLRHLPGDRKVLPGRGDGAGMDGDRRGAAGGARGFGFGWLAMLSAVGSGWSAILYGTILHPNGISWRVLYLAAVPVLTLVALLRRRLPESGRFLAASEHGRLASRWSEMLMPASSVPGQQDPASALNSSRPRCELWADRQEWFSLSWAIHELPAGRPADPGRRRPVSRRPRARTRTAGRRRPHRHSIPRDRRARTGSDHR